MYSFEVGPIRPPSEAESILLRLTRNCPWNRCAFCHTYKDRKFSIRKIDEIKHDIESIRFMAHLLQETAVPDGDPALDIDVMISRLATANAIDPGLLAQVAFWLARGMKSIFLQDADSMVMKAAWVVEILEAAREAFPGVRRITTYARAKTISRKTQEEVSALGKAGLNRVHIGMESGSDAVLELIQKGVTAAEQIDAGIKVKTAGCELSEYFMPGIGGASLSEENAIASAAVLSRIDPDFIRIRSVVPLPGTPLAQLIDDDRWTPQGEVEKVVELRRFIENLSGIRSRVVSDHIMNLLEDVEGKLPEDRERMLAIIDSFLGMDPDARENFIVGRRLGRFRFLSDYEEREDIDRMKQMIQERYGNVDAAMREIMTNYI